MKKLFFLIVCVSITACASLISGKPDSTPDYSDLVIWMEHGPCYGECPVYTLKILADGTVYYNGVAFAKVGGSQKTKINPDQMEELIAAIEDTDFFSLKDEYVVSVTDLPSVTLSITLDGQTKRIWHYGTLDCDGQYDKAPRKLCVLEAKIDDVVNSSLRTGEE